MKFQGFIIGIILFYGIFILNGNYLWGTVSIKISVDKTNISIDDTLELKIIVNNISNISIDDIKITNIEKFEILGTSTYTQFTIINGTASYSYTYVYRLQPIQIGNIVLGPAILNYNGYTYKSNSIKINVIKGNTKNNNSFLKEDNSNNTNFSINNKNFFINININKNKAFIGEPISLTVQIYCISKYNLNINEFPKLNLKNFTIKCLNSNQIYAKRVLLGNNIYNKWEIKYIIFPIMSGNFKIGPIKLNATLLIPQKRRRNNFFNDPFFDDFDDFFDDFMPKYKRYKKILTSNIKEIKVLEFPTKNRPNYFDGTIGEFKMNVKINPLELKVGEPITIQATIKGEGNIHSISEPIFENLKNFKIYKETPKINLNPYNPLKGSKIFNFTLIPLSTKCKFIPSIKFSYFSLNKKDYVTIDYPKLPIKVLPAPKNKKEDIFILKDKKVNIKDEIKVLAKDIVPIKDIEPMKWNENLNLFNLNIIAILLFLPLVLCIILYFIASYLEKIKNDPTYLRRLNAYSLAKNRLKEAFNSFNNQDYKKTLTLCIESLNYYIADRLNIPIGKVYGDGLINIIKDNIKNKNKEKIISEIREWNNKCNEIKYSGTYKKEDIENILEKSNILLKEIKKEI